MMYSKENRAHQRTLLCVMENRALMHIGLKKNQVFQEDFNNLWVITRLFVLDDWNAIRKHLEDLFNVNFTINPLFSNKALIKSEVGRMEEWSDAPGKWQDFGQFHLLIEQWNTFKRSWPEFIRGFGGWLTIKNLPLEYWRKSTFEAIGAHFRGLESIAIDTLNLLNCSEARIRVKRNLCGLMPATIEIVDDKRGNIFLNFGDIESIEESNLNKGALLLSNFSNSIDLLRLNQVAQDEGIEVEVPVQNWAFLKQNKLNPSKNPFAAMKKNSGKGFKVSPEKKQLVPEFCRPHGSITPNQINVKPRGVFSQRVINEGTKCRRPIGFQGSIRLPTKKFKY